MIKPPFLKAGDTVAIVAPARWIEQEKYAAIIQIIESHGLNVVRGKSTYLTHGPFAGTDAERQTDLQQMLDNSDIKAIFCLRGGYGTIRIIEGLNFDAFAKSSKWVIGFSDITILHSALHNMGFMSIHGQMPLNFDELNTNNGLNTLFDALFGKLLSYNHKPNTLNREGEVAAPIIGGNIAILSSLIGTSYDINTDGKILFIEEVGEYLYRFDRLMYHLKMSGKLARLSGLIVGGLFDMKDNDPTFGYSAEEIVKHVVNDYHYPVCFGFKAGHIKENFPLIFGQDICLKVSLQGCFIQF